MLSIKCHLSVTVNICIISKQLVYDIQSPFKREQFRVKDLSPWAVYYQKWKEIRAQKTDFVVNCPVHQQLNHYLLFLIKISPAKMLRALNLWRWRNHRCENEVLMMKTNHDDKVPLNKQLFLWLSASSDNVYLRSILFVQCGISSRVLAVKIRR